MYFNACPISGTEYDKGSIQPKSPPIFSVVISFVYRETFLIKSSIVFIESLCREVAKLKAFSWSFSVI